MKKYLNFFAAVFVLGMSVLPLSCHNASRDNQGGNRAVIIDQLYQREPNPAFIIEATQLLESYGFSVDLWQGAQVTVDLYRKLPSLGYKFVLLRVHSGLLVSLENGQETTLDTTYLFTAENYTATRYVSEQLSDKVSNAMMEENYPLVFAVNSAFIKSAKGDFDRTVVLAMGCESYEYDDLPQAFIAKGASVYIGWSNLVTLEHVDSVTLDLLRNLCSANMTLAQGIEKTTADLGKDPYFDSYLRYYPAGSGNLTLNELIRQ
jgi:hypothetical protein